MDLAQRLEFWETLISLDGKDIESDFKKLREKTVFPRALYRYRPVSIKSLDALRTNRVYFSTANYYDDPFDTFINVNLSNLDCVYQMLKTNDDEDVVFSTIKSLFDTISPSVYDDDKIRNMVSQFKISLSEPSLYTLVQEHFRNIRNEIKKDIWSVCFSENGCNETLWLKYAEQHKGFAVEYDLRRNDLLLCGVQEKCKRCYVNIYGTKLYPVVYSDKQYDGTRLAQFITICRLLSNNQNELNNFMNAFGNINWERERVTLIKKECHHYDEEWRMILNCSMNPPVYRKWIPTAVILGLNMGEAERNLTISAAKEAGISNIDEAFINDKGMLDSRPICGA